MTTIAALRDATARAIAENPIVVAVHRVEYADDGAGGRVKLESDLPAFTGRLLPSWFRGLSRQNEAGTVQLAPWVLLAPWNADLQAGSNVQDTFEAGGKRYRIVRVIPRAWQGQVYALHAELEEIS